MRNKRCYTGSQWESEPRQKQTLLSPYRLLTAFFRLSDKSRNWGIGMWSERFIVVIAGFCVIGNVGAGEGGFWVELCAVLKLALAVEDGVGIADYDLVEENANSTGNASQWNEFIRQALQDGNGGGNFSDYGDYIDDMSIVSVIWTW